MAYSDDISTAPEITVDGTDGGWDNLTATNNSGEPLNVSASGNNVWQKVHLIDPGAYKFQHDTGVTGDTVMTIYQGPAGATYADLVSVGSGDDEAGSSKPRISYTSPGGEWIYIESTGYHGARVSGQATLVTVVAVIPVNVWAASDYFDAWIGDCGPYVGPWPPAPPTPANLPPITDCAELDYFICADPFADIVDGSYSGDSRDVYRYYTGTGDATGANTGIGSDEVTGNLFVILYAAGYDWPASSPTPLPLDLVPSLYVSGGAGSPVPDPAGGHWSEYQDGPVIDTTAFTVRRFHGQWRVDQSIAGYHDLVPVSQDALDTLRTWPTPVSAWSESPGATASAEIFFGASKNALTGPGSEATSAFASLNGAAAVFTAGAIGVTQPPLMADLIEGLDYTGPPPGETIPADSSGGAYFDGPPEFVEWRPTTASIVTVVGVAAQTPPVTPTIGGTARLALIDPSDAIAGPAYLYSLGTTVAEITRSTTGTQTDVVDVPIDGLTDTSFAVTLLSRFMSSDDTPLQDWPDPAPGGTADGSWEILADVGGSGLVPVTRFAGTQWRYWIPGDALKWHTVGGHFATVGGAKLQILTPMPSGPSQWVDAVDGPA